MKNLLLSTVVVFFIFGFSKITAQDADATWTAPETAKETANPVAEKKRAASAKKGKKIFTSRCVFCHGATAQGDGPAGARLNPKPANLTSVRVQNQEDGEIFWKISNGKGAMPKWEAIISEEDRWNLVNFIRTLKE